MAGGGVVISGGEELIFLDFLYELELLKNSDISLNFWVTRNSRPEVWWWSATRQELIF